MAACGCTRLGVDWQQYNAQRKFEARRPQCAVQRSAASVRWAVLDGHKRVQATGSFGTAQRMQSADALKQSPLWVSALPQSLLTLRQAHRLLQTAQV
jgi:hypothetical protein